MVLYRKKVVSVGGNFELVAMRPIQNPGPWYIAHLENNRLQRQRIVHTFAEHFAFTYALLQPNDQWVMTELIGPFGIEAEALRFTGGPLPDGVYRWTFNELITIPEFTVLTLGNIRKLKK